MWVYFCVKRGQNFKIILQELEKVRLKIEKNAKDRNKLEKAGKGSFKFRLTPDQIEERRQLLEQALESLMAQRKLLQKMLSHPVVQSE